MIKKSITQKNLKKYIENLLNLFFNDRDEAKIEMKVLAIALERIEYCFSKINRKYYQENGWPLFDHLNSDHMASFLWFLSNSIWNTTKNETTATKLFYLNKIMHGLDLFYSIQMPNIFFLVHPLGTVLGNAIYKDYLVVYQNVTVGSNGNGYPEFGEGNVLYSKSSIIGKAHIGNNVIFGANSFILEKKIKDNSIVLGSHPFNKILVNKEKVVEEIFNIQKENK